MGPSLSGADDDFSFAVTAATGSSGVNGGEPYNQETVPLSSATEDEWGWEDGGGDVEMATGANNRLKEEDDLQMAMALSISESQSKSTPLSAMQPKNVISTKTKSTSSPVGISSSGTSSAAVGIGVGTGAGSSRFSVASTSAPTPAPAPAPAPAVSRPDDFATLLAESRPNHVPSSQYITSFSKKTKPPVPQKVEKKTAEDDIFASMGLSAKPKFSTNTVPTSSRFGAATSTSGWRSTLGAGSSSNVTSSLAAAAEVNADDLDTGSNWDDDNDLDDLLDD
uniref:Uncharacterized protein n=1 Tax=Trieres chinensis TaxID=1514140 RepID=A0A7S1ZW10_TRICV